MHRALHSVAARLADTDPAPGHCCGIARDPPCGLGFGLQFCGRSRTPGPSSSSAWAGAEGPGARGEAASPAKTKSLV